MSDLIRREDVIKLVNQFVFGLCKGQNYEVRRTFNKYIEKIPTAYDIDNVVEEIEKANQGCCNYCGCDLYSDDVIEIVKQGCYGTGTGAETIRDKAVKWNKNSTKKVPYEFIDFVEGKRETDVSDDVCKWEYDKHFEFAKSKCGSIDTHRIEFNKLKYCPYCGKKIKVGIE